MADADGIAAARPLLCDAIARRLFPCAAVCIGSSERVVWHEAFGQLTFESGAPPATPGTWFDLASLTKPLATTTVVLDLVARGRLNFSDPIATLVPAWRAADRRSVTVADLLEHASGLAARFADAPPHARHDFLTEICASPLAYPPRTQALYSDLGFILLGLLAETGAECRLDGLFTAARQQLPSLPAGMLLDPTHLGFAVPVDHRARTAPTEPLGDDTERRHRLVAEVHDPYAAALDGVAGHAGLFGTASGVAAFAAGLLRSARGTGPRSGPFSPGMTHRATRPSSVPGSSRALGWDLMRPTSSCGTRMSAAAFGHVGFTGTSLWIDPVRDRFFVLLTNRACGGGTVEDMRELRRDFHDALAEV